MATILEAICWKFDGNPALDKPGIEVAFFDERGRASDGRLLRWPSELGPAPDDATLDQWVAEYEAAEHPAIMSDAERLEDALIRKGILEPSDVRPRSDRRTRT